MQRNYSAVLQAPGSQPGAAHASPAALGPVWPALGKDGRDMDVPCCSSFLVACISFVGQSLMTSKSISKPSACRQLVRVPALVWDS